ncbi:MAG: DUF2304 domain-containing protein [Erysipelotrichaceae bacterium]|nr:DUF2304 domain-containing protein [Erysipelotrichaceae bacterium]
MSSSLRLGLLIASLIAFSFVLFFVLNKKLNIKYSIVWLLWALSTLIMAIFPETFYQFSHLVGIAIPVNAVFLIMIGLLYGLTFYVYIMISKHNLEIIRLTYEVARLKKELEETKKK